MNLVHFNGLRKCFHDEFPNDIQWEFRRVELVDVGYRLTRNTWCYYCGLYRGVVVVVWGTSNFQRDEHQHNIKVGMREKETVRKSREMKGMK